MSTQPEQEPQAPNIEALQAENARLTAENEAMKAREAAVAELLATAAEQAGELSETLRNAARMLGATAMSASVENPAPAESAAEDEVSEEDSNEANIREQAAVVAAAPRGTPSAAAVSAEGSQTPEAPQPDEPELSAGEAEIARIRAEDAADQVASDGEPETDRTLIIPADDADDRPVRRRITPTAPADGRGGRRRAGGERRRRLRRRFAMIGAAALVAAGAGGAYLAGWFDKNDRGTDGKSVPEAVAEINKNFGLTDKSAEQPKKSSAAGSSERSFKDYKNVDTGSDAQGLIGQTSFNVNHEKGSFYNFKEELRKNPQALAFWKTCLESGNVSYASCVGDKELLNKVEWRAKNFANMDAETKAKQADAVVAMFNGTKFDGNQIQFVGVKSHSGMYRTVATNTQGEFFGQINSRSNDPWLVFKFTDKDGRTKTFHVRECDQLVEAMTMKVPKSPDTKAPSGPIGGPEDKPRTPVDTVTPGKGGPKVTPPVTSTPATTPPIVTPPAETPPETPDEEKKDDAVLPGNPAVPADQDPGTPDVAGAAPATPGLTPGVPQVPATPPAGQELPANLPPAETGTPTGAPQENVPGTGNASGQGQGGSTNPNDV